MARRRRQEWIAKAFVLAALVVVGLESPAQAQERELELSAAVAFTTDYVYRGLSNTKNGPAVQPEFDLTYGMFYAGIWGSNVDYGAVGGRTLATIEIDYYAGIAPSWAGISFDIGGIYYTFPGYCEGPCGSPDPDYFELKTGASYTIGEKLTLGVTNYWAPDYFGVSGNSNAVEGSASYAFATTLFNVFSPSVSGLIGFQSFEIGPDYAYWNMGLTLGFMTHWSADIRYSDTDLGTGGCVAASGFTDTCDERVVGTVKAVF